LVGFYSVSPSGRLTGGKIYCWDGWIGVRAAHSYVFHDQCSAAVSDANVGFFRDNSRKIFFAAVVTVPQTECIF
jgi:hypothetical protein